MTSDKVFSYFLYLFVLILSTTSRAQTNTKRYQFIKRSGLLSKTTISAIAQDSKSVIWLGSYGNGLYKFDGSSYTTYQHKNDDPTTISSDVIQYLYTDSNNRLWIATENGLNTYNKELNTFTRVSLNNTKHDKLSPNHNIYSLSGNKSGQLYIGTAASGFFILDTKTNAISNIPFASNHNGNTINITDITVTKNGTIYIATNFGLKTYDANTNTIRKATFHNDNGAITIDNSIQTLFIDTTDNLYLGTHNHGLIKISVANPEDVVVNHYKLTTKRILKIAEIPDGTLMIGTENDGLIHIESNGRIIDTYKYKKSGQNFIQSNSIWSLFVDNNQRIWAGFYNNGISIYDKLSDKFQDLKSITANPNSLESSSVTGIVEKDQKLWISMDGGGIDVYDPKRQTFNHINSNNSSYLGNISDDLQTIFIDSNENIWAGSWNNGLFLLKKDQKQFINYSNKTHPDIFYSNSVLSFDEDSKGTIWMGTFYNGVISYNPKNQIFTHHVSKSFTDTDLNQVSVRKVLVDKDDNVWVGSTSGLFKIEQSDSILKVTPFKDRMSRVNENITNINHILSLCEDTKGIIWIGTRGAGLCSYDKIKDEFIWHNTTTLIKGKTISSIIDSNDNSLWFTTNSGIVKYNPTTKVSKQYTKNDGLLSNSFNFNAVYKNDDGVLYFGNYEGLDYFNPKDIIINEKLPTLQLTNFKLFNKNVIPNQKDSPLKTVISETEELILTHKQSVFTLDYVAINFTKPENNNYAYYLEGLENNWNYVDNQTSATYTNLDQGEYIFKLKAANNDGIWNSTPLSLKITVLPPWWKTNIALCAYVLLFCLAIYSLNKITQNRVREKQQIVNERTQRAQIDELNEKKLQFFTNISHEFRTPLSLIINPLEGIINDTTLNLPLRAKEKLQIIHKNTDRLYRLINELMDFRKLELNKAQIKAKELDLVHFSNDVVDYFKEEAINRNIDLTIDSDLPKIPIWADERMLEKIIFNILSNAIKVTPDGGAINIDLQATDTKIKFPLIRKDAPLKAIEIIISDTGPGLKKKHLKRIFDRFYQVDNKNKTYYDSTGIGLEVVKSFVQLHKGIIKVDSTYGIGTSFKVLLPEGKAHLTEEEIYTGKKSDTVTTEPVILKPVSETTDSVDLETDTEPKPSKTNTILIIEDNSDLRNYLKDELKNTYKVITAKNGKDGLKVAQESLPDIILTDVIMPEMNGFEFCKFIKNDLRTSHIPLLMLTAKARIDDRIQGIEMGADAYMVKPFNIRLLKLRLSQLITSRQLIFEKYFGAISGINDDNNTNNTTSLDKDFIQKVLKYISENISDSDLSVELLASELHLSRSQLYRKIKSLTGQTVNEFLRKTRLQKAKQILETDTNASISEVCYKVGFSSPSYFTKCFKSHFGILPTEIGLKNDD